MFVDVMFLVVRKSGKVIGIESIISTYTKVLISIPEKLFTNKEKTAIVEKGFKFGYDYLTICGSAKSCEFTTPSVKCKIEIKKMEVL